MFIHRLAARFGIIDVDAVANSLTPEQLLEHKSVAIIEGWYHGKADLAELIAIIHNQVNRMLIVNSTDPKGASQALEWLSGSEVLKTLTTFKKVNRQKRSSNMMSPADAANVLAARYRR